MDGKKQPLVSVILPCYNVEKLIDRCLQSIVDQTIGADKLEIICVDDCSKDGTREKLLSWEQKYPDNFCAIMCERNGRQGKARNIGLMYATGEWIAFIDSDDWVDPDYFEKMLNAAKAPDLEMVCCDGERDFSKELTYFEKGQVSSVKDYLIETDEDRRKILLDPPFGYCAWGKIIKKDFLVNNDIWFPENITYEDAVWGSIFHLYIRHASVISDKLYHYFVNDESTVLTKNSNHHLDAITSQTMLWKEYTRRGFLDKFREELELEHIYSGYLVAIKAAILRYEIPDYNIYLLTRELMLDRIGNYKNNKYVAGGCMSEMHMLILSAMDNVLSRDEFIQFAENIKKIGI
jgi:glycosyltransferase involved in cell wall biosynthesis